MAEKKESFFRPFEQLEKLRDSLPAGPGPVKREPKRSAKAAEPKPIVAPAPTVSDETLYEREMAKVKPLAHRLDTPVQGKTFKIGNIRSPEELDYSEFSNWASGDGTFELSNSDEHVEGLGPGIDRRLLVRLRRGEYAIQAHLDLHGLTVDEAKGEVDRFIDTARQNGKRSVLIIHGRGLHSKDQTPLLKERVLTWLTHTRLARDVLAFSSARPSDGGTGALYLLLRKI